MKWKIFIICHLYLLINFGLFGLGIAEMEANQDVDVNSSIPLIGEVHVLTIFTAFKDQPQDSLPSWANDLFNPNLPNSLTHYFDVQSGGRHILTGDVVPQWYYADYDYHPDVKKYQFIASILEKVDLDIDFSTYDNWAGNRVKGADGYVDMLFVIIANSPWQNEPLLASYVYETNSKWPQGYIKIKSLSGTTQSYRSQFEQQSAIIAHEYGHVLGLKDMYDKNYSPAFPDQYSAGIGLWDVMSEGYGSRGLYSMCEYNKIDLEWISVIEIYDNVFNLKIKPNIAYKVRPKAFYHNEYFLVTYRDHNDFYDQKLASGLLIWHIDEDVPGNNNEYHKEIDLECADGLYDDKGYPGQLPNPISGGDNLDFWSKASDDYNVSHNGNPADSTDPYDGESYTSFTPYTNPNSNGYSSYWFQSSGNVKVNQKKVSHLAITNIKPDGNCDIIFNYWEGQLDINTTWQTDEGIYYLGNDLLVPKGITLYIEAGVKIEMNGHSIRSIGGTIYREGAGTSIEINEDSKNIWSLIQNSPNPFNAETMLRYELPEEARVRLDIYNLLGQRVRILIDHLQTKGLHHQAWDGKDDSGNLATSGIYIYQLQAGGFQATKRMLLMR